LLATDTPLSHYEQNGKYVVEFRYDVPAVPMKNRLGIIVNLEVAKSQSNNSVQLDSFMSQVHPLRGALLAATSMSEMNRNMKNLTLDMTKTRVGLPPAQSPKYLESKLISARNRLVTRVVAGSRNHVHMG
jgi:hypothetical protein